MDNTQIINNMHRKENRRDQLLLIVNNNDQQSFDAYMHENFTNNRRHRTFDHILEDIFSKRLHGSPGRERFDDARLQRIYPNALKVE